jgi:hypothetical protein
MSQENLDALLRVIDEANEGRFGGVEFVIARRE